MKINNSSVDFSFHSDMDLAKHYHALYQEAVQRLISDEYQIDRMMDTAQDLRRGITLLLRPNEEVVRHVGCFLQDLKMVEPDQYYQPDTDMHLTVMSIISCYEGFDLDGISLPEYVALIERSLQHIGPIRIHFKGITASPSCILIQGFPQNDTLDKIRNTLRDQFKNSHLQQSIDSRYSLRTAHMTVARFRRPLVQKEAFLQVLENYRTFDFGQFTTDHMELVYNDWYQKKEKVRKLGEFSLQP